MFVTHYTSKIELKLLQEFYLAKSDIQYEIVNELGGQLYNDRIWI